jgi:hypothetical protein
MSDLLLPSLGLFADTSGAIAVVRDYVLPTIQVLAGLASIAFVFFVINGGYLYITSNGKPDRMEQAKNVLKKATLGLVIVLAALTITSILSNAYGSPHDVNNAALPSLQSIEPNQESNGLIDIIIKAVTGFLVNIISSAGEPFLKALDFFTKATPSMAENQSVFNFWLAMVGIADVLFALVVALLGLHVMSASTFGFDEVEFKHLLPRFALIFLLMNTSIFLIDGIIELSNVLITAVGKVSGATSVWETLIEIVKKTSGQGLAALFMMLAFVILSVVLVVYYVMRLVTLYIGAVLSPLISLVWLVPGFRDFAETAFKTYITTIFVLFVHVVILQLAASLFTGMATASGDDQLPNALMAMVVGIAAILTLLKVQGTMMQFSYVSMGARNMRKLGGQFINGVSYMAGKGRTGAVKAASATKSTATKIQNSRTASRIQQKANSTPEYNKPRADKSGVTITRTQGESNTGKTGTTYESPKATSLKSTHPKNSSKDKVK